MKFIDLKVSQVPVQKAKKWTKSDFGRSLVVLTEESHVKAKNFLSEFPDFVSQLVRVQVSRLFEQPKAGDVMKFLGGEGEPDVILAVLPKDESSFSLLGFGKKVSQVAIGTSIKRLSIFCHAKNEVRIADCLGSAVAARIFAMPEYGKRTEKAKPYSLEAVDVLASKAFETEFVRGLHKGNGSNVIRYLGSLPPNVLGAGEYAVEIQKLCKSFGWQHEFHSNKALKKMGAEAFTAVDRGDPDSKGGIHEITYSPRAAKNKKPLVLVGKGLCFDTGGYDVKTGGYMISMKGDMQGSAVCLATLMMASKMKWPLKMKAFLGVTENHISPKAYKADEVVKALNGLTIEVVNTDAEGRMVLADTLCLADREEPALLMDFATLTGSAVRSLGKSYAAGFTNQEKLHEPIKAAGRESGERVWTFPLDADYGKPLESTIADTLQCVKAPGVDHIYAAFFLNRFVNEKTPWVHIDLAASEKEGGLAHTDSVFTGYGARFAAEFIESYFKV